MPGKKRKPPTTAPIFDAFCVVQGFDAKTLNKIERGKINAAVAVLCPYVAGLSPFDINVIAAEVHRRWPLFKAANPNIQLYTAMGLAGQWSHFEIIRTQHEILKEFVRDWFLKNRACLQGINRTEEFERIFLHVEGERMAAGPWKKSPKLHKYAQARYMELERHCDLRPAFIEPHVAAALEALAAREKGKCDDYGAY